MQVGAKWLRDWCHQAAATSSAASSDDTLALAVSQVLLASKSADEAAAELFDLLGDGHFDAIMQLLEHRYQSLSCCYQCPTECMQCNDTCACNLINNNK